MERIPVSDWPQFRATVYIPAWYHARIGMTFHLDFLNNMSFMFLYLCYTSCYMLHLFNASHITYTEIHCIHIFLEQWRLIDFLIDKAYLSLQHTFFVTSVFVQTEWSIVVLDYITFATVALLFYRLICQSVWKQCKICM